MYSTVLHSKQPLYSIEKCEKAKQRGKFEEIK
jgi:hypothetical protein